MFLFNINWNIEENLELTLISIPLLTICLFRSEVRKTLILTDNKGKSGVYKWRNKINGKIYIGSSLSKRLRNYFKIYLADLKDIMIIYKALLSHRFDNFKLPRPLGGWGWVELGEILEHCKPSD